MEPLLKQLENENDFIVLSNNSIKQKLIQAFSSKLRKITFKSFEDIKKEIYPEIDCQVLFDNMDDSTDLEVLRIKLKNSFLIEKDNNNQLLHELYMYRLKNNFFIDPNYLKYYNSKTIYIINYYFEDDLINNILHQFMDDKFLYANDIKNIPIEILRFKNMEDEVFNVVNNIATLLKQNVLPSNIVIHKVDGEYLLKLEEVLMMYKIDYQIESSNNLIDINYTKQLINKLVSYQGQRLNQVLKQLIVTEPSHIVLDQIIVCLENLRMLDLKINYKTIQLIKDTLLHTTFQDEQYSNVIRIENVFDHIYDDHTHIFIMNFSQNEIPRIFKDDEYIKDELRQKMNLITSMKKNEFKRKKIIDFIHNYKYIYLSLSRTEGLGYLMSNICDDLEFKRKSIVKDQIFDFNNILNKEVAKHQFVKAKAKYNLYKEKTDDYIKGYNIFNRAIDIYNSEYSGKNLNFFNLNHKNLELSYTKLNDYFNCPFSYYVKYILNIKEQSKPNNSTLVGSIYHYVLEKVIYGIYILKKPKDSVICEIKSNIEDFISIHNVEITDKLNFYINKFEKELITVIDAIVHFMDNSCFEVYQLEAKLEASIDDKTKLIGYIDKILKYKDYYIAIDYKTNKVNLDWHMLDVGIDFQIPIYLYLIKENIPNALIGGGYLQSIYQSSMLQYDHKPYMETYIKNRKYEGYTLQDIDVIKNIDTLFGCGEGSLPKQIWTNNGFHKNFLKKSFTSEEFEQIIAYVKEKIIRASIEIREGLFFVRPLTNEKNEIVCSKCKLKDLCYRNPNMKKTYTKHPDFSYLFKRRNQNENSME